MPKRARSSGVGHPAFTSTRSSSKYALKPNSRRPSRVISAHSCRDHGYPVSPNFKTRTQYFVPLRAARTTSQSSLASEVGVDSTTQRLRNRIAASGRQLLQPGVLLLRQADVDPLAIFDFLAHFFLRKYRL